MSEWWCGETEAASGRSSSASSDAVTGRPPVNRREIQQRFWRKVAEGLSSEDAAIACGVSTPVGTRWFREAGGMPPISLAPPSGRYLSFAEREDIALLKARGAGVREMARKLGHLLEPGADRQPAPGRLPR